MNLKRIITSGRYIPEVDGLRFLAILVVVLYHIPGNLARNIAINANSEAPAALFGGLTAPLSFLHSAIRPAYGLGVEGVLLFFSISGFILSLPFARHHLLKEQPVSMKKYFIRRITRLEPPYVIAMIALLLAGAALGRFDLAKQLPHLLASLLYVHNILYGQSSTINNAAWSLEVEVQFYIMAPLVCWLAFRKPRRGCFLIPLAVLACGVFVAAVPMKVITIAKFLHYFLAGVGAGGIYVANPGWFASRAGWADAVFGGAVALAGVTAHAGSLPRELTLPWCFAAMLICALKGKWFAAVLRLPLVASLGGMCYTTYLYHGRLLTLPIVFILSRVALTNAFASDVILATCVLVPFVFAASIPLFLLFEKPFMNPNWPADWAQRIRRVVSR
jgi:peptidoglycan/LPS O-acetylase OafA/YrhL